MFICLRVNRFFYVRNAFAGSGGKKFPTGFFTRAV